MTWSGDHRYTCSVINTEHSLSFLDIANYIYIYLYQKIDSYCETDSYARGLVTTLILYVFKSLFSVLISYFNHYSYSIEVNGFRPCIDHLPYMLIHR